MGKNKKFKIHSIDFTSLFKSFYFFLKLFFRKIDCDVVFSYPNYFNRSYLGSNSFIEPMIETCKKNNIKYIVFEDCDLGGGYNNYPRNKDNIPFDFITLLRIVFNKFYKNKSLVSSKNEHYFIRERSFAKVIKRFLLRNINFNVCINMAGENLALFKNIRPTALVCEYQHGIIYDGHEDYLVNGKAEPYIKKNNATFLVFGAAYKDILINYDGSGYYTEANVIDLGFKENYRFYKEKNNKVLLFSLGIVPDIAYSLSEMQIIIINDILKNNRLFLEENGYKVIIKKHPRYDDRVCPKIKFDCPFVHIYENGPIDDLLSDSSIHITFNSTFSFDVALRMMPTIFISREELFRNKNTFFKQYKYPLKSFIIEEYSDLEKILIKCEEPKYYEKVSHCVYGWSKKFYSDYNDAKFISMVLDNRK